MAEAAYQDTPNEPERNTEPHADARGSPQYVPFVFLEILMQRQDELERKLKELQQKVVNGEATSDLYAASGGTKPKDDWQRILEAHEPDGWPTPPRASGWKDRCLVCRQEIAKGELIVRSCDKRTNTYRTCHKQCFFDRYPPHTLPDKGKGKWGGSYG